MKATPMNKNGMQEAEGDGPGSFQPTRWSLVAVAAKAGSSQADAALNDLCQIYWHPLYCYVRRRGHSPDDAQDLVQGFFERLLRKEFFSGADQAKGRLRGFLLSSFQYYLLDERKRLATVKRGGEVDFVSIDTSEAESRYVGETDSSESPDAIFERRWALTVLQRAVGILGEAWRREGKGDVFDALSAHLFSPMEATATRQIAERFQMTESHVKVSLHRLRERYAAVLRREIADTVNSPAEIDSELAQLRAAAGW